MARGPLLGLVRFTREAAQATNYGWNVRFVPIAEILACMLFYETRFIPGGCHVPSPAGRTDGGVVFGQ